MEKKREKLSIALIIGLAGFPQISETIYTPALPNVAQSLHTSASMVEATLAIYFLGFAIGVVVWGMIADLYGRRLGMLMGLLIYGLSTIGCGLSANVETLLLWRFAQAFGASVGSVIIQTLLRDLYSGTERTKLFSVITGSLAFSPAIGPLLGGFTSEFFGWRANFWLLSVTSIILFIWSYTALPETRPQGIKKVSLKNLGSLFMTMVASRQFLGHCLLIGATNGILFGFYQEAPFVFIEHLGMQPGYYGLFGLLIAAASLVASRIVYRMSGTVSAESLIQFGISCIILGGGIFSAMILTGIFSSTMMEWIATILCLFSIFFGIGLIIPNSLSNALKPYQAYAGSAGSVFGGIYYLMIAGFTWFMSVIHNGTSLPLPLYITGLSLVLLIGSRMIRFSACAEKSI